MTALPARTEKKLGLVIDLDTCVGCQACVISCKEWNSQGYGAPLADMDAYGAEPEGSFLNRVHAFEAVPDDPAKGPPVVVHFPKSCLHCDDAPCVTVCPTGASYKRSEDGIVLVEEDWCIGCGLCAWACPYGAREMDGAEKVMKKCTLCVDRIYNEHIPEEDRVPSCVRTCPTGARHFGDLGDPESDVSRLVAERGGMDLMPEQGTRPVNKYLPPRPKGAPPILRDPGQRDAGMRDAGPGDQGPAGAGRGEVDVLAPFLEPVAEDARGFLGWLDRSLGRL